MKFESLHESAGLTDEIARKRNIETYEEFKRTVKTQGYNALSLRSPLQRVVATLISAIEIAGDKPRYLIINRQMALDFVEAKQEIPSEVEGVPIAYSEDQIFGVCWLA